MKYHVVLELKVPNIDLILNAERSIEMEDEVALDEEVIKRLEDGGVLIVSAINSHEIADASEVNQEAITRYRKLTGIACKAATDAAFGNEMPQALVGCKLATAALEAREAAGRWRGNERSVEDAKQAYEDTHAAAKRAAELYAELQRLNGG